MDCNQIATTGYRIAWLDFNPEVFRQAEARMQRKKLARLHNAAAALGLKLVPAL